MINKEKSVLIFGTRASGRTSMALGMCRDYKDDEVCIIDGRNFKNDFRLTYPCTKATKVLVIDEVPAECITSIIAMHDEGIAVERPMEELFVIHPKVIAVIREKDRITDTWLGSAAHRRLHVIECRKYNSV